MQCSPELYETGTHTLTEKRYSTVTWELNHIGYLDWRFHFV